MDLTRPISYRGFQFNTYAVEGGNVLEGCVTDRVQWGEVEVSGYIEKRALDNGYDAADVTLGRRSVTLSGFLHGRNRPALFDLAREMRMAVDPVLAYDEKPERKGFLPLKWTEPTNHVDLWEGDTVPLMLHARAVNPVVTDYNRDKSGGDDRVAISVPWSLRFVAIDPRVYIQQRQEIYIGGAGGNLALENRGGHPVPLSMLLVAGPNTSMVRHFDFVGGGADFRLSFPASEEVQVIRFDGEKKVITLSVNDTEKNRMDTLSLDTDWPILPLGITDVAWNFKREDGTDGNLRANSILFHREAFS